MKTTAFLLVVLLAASFAKADSGTVLVNVVRPPGSPTLVSSPTPSAAAEITASPVPPEATGVSGAGGPPVTGLVSARNAELFFTGVFDFIKNVFSSLAFWRK